MRSMLRITALLCLFLGSLAGTASAEIISGKIPIAIDCCKKHIVLGELAVKTDSREAFVGYRSRTIAGVRLDVAKLPDCCHELDFINVVLQDSAPPTWVDENGNHHDLKVPFIDPPWKWDSGAPRAPKADNLPFYDGQFGPIKASKAGGILGADFALDDLLGTPKDKDPTLTVVFGDEPSYSDSIKFATLLVCADRNQKEVQVCASFTWGGTVKGGEVTALPLNLAAGFPAGLNANMFQDALNQSGFGTDIMGSDGKLQHKGEGWKDPAFCVVPEPSSMVLFGAGIGILVVLRRKRGQGN